MSQPEAMTSMQVSNPVAYLSGEIDDYQGLLTAPLTSQHISSYLLHLGMGPRSALVQWPVESQVAETT